MVYFQTKNPNFGLFSKALEWKIFVYFMSILVLLSLFGVFYRHLPSVFYRHLVYFAVILYIFSHFDMLRQGKSGNPTRKWRVKPGSFYFHLFSHKFTAPQFFIHLYRY
jgi:uncharacterized membrane protein YfcA